MVTPLWPVRIVFLFSCMRVLGVVLFRIGFFAYSQLLLKTLLLLIAVNYSAVGSSLIFLLAQARSPPYKSLVL